MSVNPALQKAEAALAAGRMAEAEQAFRRVVSREPGNAEAIAGLMESLARQGNFAQAAFFAQRVTDLRPGSANARANLAVMLERAGKPDEAMAAARAGLVLEPSSVACMMALGMLCSKRGEGEEAERVYRRVLEIDPTHPVAWFNLEKVLANSGRADASFELASEAIARTGGNQMLRELQVRLSNYALTEPETLWRVHREGAAFVQRAVPPATAFQNDPTPDRALRIGLISPDFRAHSVMFFAWAVIEELKRLGHSVYAYHTDDREDPVTAQVKQAVAQYRPCARVGGAALCQLMRSDRIDIAIDLVGWFERGRLEALARRPAPVVVNYCGYPNSTGLTTVDARLVDSITDPPGSEAFASEKLVRLDPCFLCYRPLGDAPDVSMRPADSPPTVGSFNAVWKTGKVTANLWARVLAESPEATLVLKSSAGRSASAGWLPAALGVDASRVRFLDFSPTQRDHLAAYRELDVALDTFPYHGTTTTCEALFMGVPVVTLAGRTHGSRVSASLLRAVGLDDLVAEDEAEYSAVVRRLLGDRARLIDLRSSLRKRMLGGTLCDQRGFGDRLGAALRELWQRWCRG